MIRLMDWGYFFLLGLLIFGWWRRRKRPSLDSIRFSGTSQFKALEDRSTIFLSRLLLILRYFTFILIIIALVRPQGISTENEIHAKGIDIMLALDVSGSMRAEDFKPNNRLVVAKEKVQQFIEGRHSDRIGLVVFGSEAFTQSPLTLDYGIILNLLNRIEIGMAGDGTAVGMAIATALNRLKDSDAKSKIIILLTDGVSNSGEIDPVSAAKLAESMNVKVYTIGIGKEGGAPIPYDDPVYGKQYARHADGRLVMTEIDEDTLKRIAARTNAHYFRAVDPKSLQDIYSQINSLEKSEIKTKTFKNYHDYFPHLLWMIFILMGAELLLSNVFLVRVP